MPRTFPAVMFNQHGRRMFSLVVPGGWLTDRVIVDVYDPRLSVSGLVKGYQRTVEEARARKIGQFLIGRDSVMPSGVLLSVRGKRQLEWRRSGGETDDQFESGTLTVPDGTTVYLVDGQHRQEGVRLVSTRHPSIRSFPFPAVLMEGNSDEQEALQFYLLNTKAKKVPTDLSRRILIERGLVRYVESPQEWLIKAVQVAIALNTSIENPWRGRIKPPNMTRQPQHVCSEKSFVSSLQYVLSSPVFKRSSPKRTARALAAYWSAVQDVFPSAFANPRANVVQKTAGIYSLHMLAPRIVRSLGLPIEKVSPELLAPRLSAWRRLPEGFWRGSNSRGAKRFGTGITGFQELAGNLARLAKVP